MCGVIIIDFNELGLRRRLFWITIFLVFLFFSFLSFLLLLFLLSLTGPG